MAMSPWLPFEWIAATRFLREGRTQSLLIIVGVGVGVSVIVFMSALLSGLQSNLVKRTLSSQATSFCCRLRRSLARWMAASLAKAPAR
jgi:ABC-type lipoprotein release transport system permease subunit